MQELIQIQPDQLSSQAVYQIDGCLYYFIKKDDSGRVVKYIFLPLASERKKSELKLSRDKIHLLVKQVPSIYGRFNNQESEYKNRQNPQNPTQLTLF